MMEKLDDIAQALTDSIDKDGQTEATGNLDMGGFRLTELGTGVSSTDAATLGQVAYRFIERQTPTGSPTYLAFVLPGGFTQFRAEFAGLSPTANGLFIAQISVDGGSTWLTGGSDYQFGWSVSFAPGYGGPLLLNFVGLSSEVLANSEGVNGSVLITPGVSGEHNTFFQSVATCVNAATGGYETSTYGGGNKTSSVRPTNIRFAFNAATFLTRGSITLTGLPAA